MKMIAPKPCDTTVDQAAPATPARGKPPRPKIQSQLRTMSTSVEKMCTTRTTRVWPRPAKKVARVAISTTGKAPIMRIVAYVDSLFWTSAPWPASANTGPVSGARAAMMTPAASEK